MTKGLIIGIIFLMAIVGSLWAGEKDDLQSQIQALQAESRLLVTIYDLIPSRLSTNQQRITELQRRLSEMEKANVGGMLNEKK